MSNTNIVNGLIKIEIKNDAGEVVEAVQLKRVPRSKYKDLISLLQLLIEAFVDCNGATGSVIADDKNWKTLKTLCAMLPIVGGDDSKGFDIEQIENDIILITRLFFTQAVAEDGSVDLAEGFKPSILAEFYQLDYSGFLQRAVREIEAKKQTTTETNSKE